MKIRKRVCALVLGFLAVMLFPVSVFAAGSIDLNHSHSLTVTAVYGQKPISGMQFDAYFISRVDECGELTVIDRYLDYQDDLDIRGKDDESWQTMAQILAREILLDKELKPSRSTVTGRDGAAVFPDMSMGLYLILGSTIETDGYVYSTSPFFVMLPENDLSSNTWNYDVVANAKPGQEPIREDYTVIKVWKDDCHKDQRPQSITISLICDGEVYSTITLPHSGAWSYTWEDLETNHQWTVTEEKEDGYQEPDIQQNGSAFIITNTCDKPTQPDEPTLPQTGQLWWPVPVLIAAGLFLIVIGLFRRRGISDEA